MRPRMVDDVLPPFACRRLLEPAQPVAVRAGREHVVSTVAVDVDDVHESPLCGTWHGWTAARGTHGNSGIQRRHDHRGRIRRRGRLRWWCRDRALRPVRGMKLPFAWR